MAATLNRLQKDSEFQPKPSLLSYVFFPLSTLLSRNEPSEIPDQVLERIFNALECLFHWWWWTCEEALWAQALILGGSILGGMGRGGKGKSRERDDETKTAAATFLLSLLQNQTLISPAGNASSRLETLRLHAETSALVPMLGQILNTLLDCTISDNMALQLSSLRAAEAIVSFYIPDTVVTSILPGVVSTAVRVSLAQRPDMIVNRSSRMAGKGWANGSIVEAALSLLGTIVVRAFGDEACLTAGIVKEVVTLEDLVELASGPASSHDSESSKSGNGKPYETLRTSSWLRGSASQLLIALNSLTPLASHPTSSALLALSSLSYTILSKARLTLPDARPLLLTFLLSLSNSQFSAVSAHARVQLVSLLDSHNKGRHELLQALMQHAVDGLSDLPRLLHSQAEEKIIRVAGQVEAVCTLGETETTSSSAIQSGVSKLLGPTGHIEKWGWRLLSSIELLSPSSPISTFSSTIPLLPGIDSIEESAPIFPEVTLKHAPSRETRQALERMLRALGRTGRDDCLFAVEWFIGIGCNQNDRRAASALWCSCRLLEGASGVSGEASSDMSVQEKTRIRGRRMEKFARWIAKTISETWEKQPVDEDTRANDLHEQIRDEDERPAIEFVKGLTPLQTRFDSRLPNPEPQHKIYDTSGQLILSKSLALQLLSISASILQSRFGVLLIHALFPVLHSLVSPSLFLSSSARAALQYYTDSMGYASPANLLLANFDYALDGVAKRLTRRSLDIDAPKVLVILVRLVGRDVVHRAGDVVEACFDRLDDFHGYEIVVEGLIEALLEVVKTVEVDEESGTKTDKYSPPEPDDVVYAHDKERFETFMDWLGRRHDSSDVQGDQENYGPPPRQAWGKGKEKLEDENENENENKDKDENGNEQQTNDVDPLADPPPTPTQALTTQIISRSLYLLTHGSAAIRTRILILLAASVPILPASALLPAVHSAWPFVIRRLGDSETHVIASAASLIEVLSSHHGSFMTARVWDDCWPRFLILLTKLDQADATSALARRRNGFASVGTESSYTHSHQLYRAMLRTMTAAVQGGVQVQDRRSWEVMMAFRRFLHSRAHEELQNCARQLYIAFGKKNEDAVWVILTSTASTPGVPHLKHLHQNLWDIQNNVDLILSDLSKGNN